ncbi:hypothetical protein [Niallia sp. BSM11]|uniref:hypothetical protein n=1 Tax=Niallia sp. BSM11 TaxID=3391576 RepID=UPI003984CEA8
MKKWIFYAVVLFGNILLYQLSNFRPGTEWIYALLVLILFATSIKGWKKSTSSGLGLIVLIAFSLFMINSILYLLMPAIFTILFSFLLGLVLIPFYSNHREVIIIAWWMVISNILVTLALPNELVLWFTLVTAGIGVLIGYRIRSRLFMVFFTACFIFSACFLFLIYI